jgi:hypothetical protein
LIEKYEWEKMLQAIPLKPNNLDVEKTELSNPSNVWDNKQSSIPLQFLRPPHPTDKTGAPTVRILYSYFLEEDLARQKAAASEVGMVNADVLDDTDDYNSMLDGLDSDISHEAIKEAILQSEKGTIIITDTPASLKKCSPIDVEKRISPINVDKEQI